MPTSIGVLGNRLASEVAHPAQKVLMFDEYDRYAGSFGQYFGFDDSRSIMVFYDGSAGRFATAKSDIGFSPNNPDFPTPSYRYTPVAGWDPPGAGEAIVPILYDQTRDGLQGIDYQRGSVRRPIRSR